MSLEYASADEKYCEEDLEEIDAAVASYLESATEVAESDTLKLADVMERMRATDNLHIVPSDFNHMEFISAFTNSEKVPEVSEGLQTILSEIVYFLTHDNVLPKAKLFIGLQWTRIFSLIRKQVSENVHTKCAKERVYLSLF